MSSIRSRGVDLELLQLHPSNPFRPINWRWQAATVFARPGCRSRRGWLDAEVRRATRWLRLATKLGEDHPRVARLDPELTAAIALHRDATRRLIIEALVLADVAPDAIAGRLGVTLAVVEIFEQVLFAVRPRLPYRDQVMFVAVDPEGGLTKGCSSTATIVRLLAYHGGEHVASAALSLACAEGKIDPESARRLALLVDGLGVAITPRTAPLLVRTHALHVQLARRRAARQVAVFMGPVFTSDFSAHGDSNGPFLGAKVRAAGAPNCPSARATQPPETTPLTGASVGPPPVRHEPVRRTACAPRLAKLGWPPRGVGVSVDGVVWWARDGCCTRRWGPWPGSRAVRTAGAITSRRGALAVRSRRSTTARACSADWPPTPSSRTGATARNLPRRSARKQPAWRSPSGGSTPSIGRAG